MNVTDVHVHVAEDEPLARRTLVHHVRSVPWVGFVSESRDGTEAEEFIERNRPHIVMLDIAMPGLTGLEVSRRLTYAPAIVFTTAFDQHAIAAFELGAVDYLLKPFGRGRVQKALQRARLTIGVLSGAAARAQQVLADDVLATVFVRESDSIRPVPVDLIERAEGSDDYVTLHVPPREYLISTRLQALEQRLSTREFVRVHRSHLVNMSAIVRVDIRPDGRGTLEMKSGAKVPMSRAGALRVRKLML